MDSVWDSKGPNLIPDHIIQLLLHLCRGLCTLSQDHIRINALPLNVVVNPASSRSKISVAGCLLHVLAFHMPRILAGHDADKRVQCRLVQMSISTCLVLHHHRQRPL